MLMLVFSDKVVSCLQDYPTHREVLENLLADRLDAIKAIYRMDPPADPTAKVAADELPVLSDYVDGALLQDGADSAKVSGIGVRFSGVRRNSAQGRHGYKDPQLQKPQGRHWSVKGALVGNFGNGPSTGKLPQLEPSSPLARSDTAATELLDGSQAQRRTLTTAPAFAGTGSF